MYDEGGILSLMYNGREGHSVLSTSKVNFSKVKPALSQLRYMVSLQPKHPFYGILVILTLSIVWRLGLRRMLAYAGLSKEPTQTKVPPKRKIVAADDGSFGSPDAANNFLKTTTFGGSYLWVACASFLYGGTIYLTQRIQVWCLLIASVQLYIFGTGKSFYPLMAFTFFMAYIHSSSELGKLKKDNDKNGRTVTVLRKSESGVTRHQIKRGALHPGDVIEVGVNEELPADMLIVGISNSKDGNNGKRVHWAMNEVQVTGETSPVKKRILPQPMSSILSIEILNLNLSQLIVNTDSENATIIGDESLIGFANSQVVSTSESFKLIGIVCWVSTEVRALNSGIVVELHRNSPFLEYSSKGFLMSIVAMISFATINAIVAYYYYATESETQVSFQTVLVNHAIYINMIVPQAMEQLRLAVCKLLWPQVKSEVRCNNPLVADILAYVVRIVSDKTGTITENRMVAKIQAVFGQDGTVHIHDEASVKPEQGEYQSAMAIMATTGMEPEEVAIRTKINTYATMLEYAPPEPADIVPGTISYNFNDKESPVQHVELKILASLGFVRAILAKVVIFQVISEDVPESGSFYVAAQVGGDEFWTNGVIPVHESTQENMAQWQTHVGTERLATYNGAPRLWSHGMKKITKEKAEELTRAWVKTLEITDKAEQSVFQRGVARDAVDSLRMVSKTFMVDAYREGVEQGIENLRKAGKQVILCTGDSIDAATTIAQHIKMPPCVALDGSNQTALLVSLRNAELRAVADKSITLVVNQECCELFRSIQKQEKGFYGEEYDIFFKLLNAKDKKERYCHSAVFCRSTPALKPWVVRLMQYKPAESLWEHLYPGRNYVLAVGDGANDVNMLRVADASVGIQSGETEDVIRQASLHHTEWHPISTLVLHDGPSMATMLSLLVKLMFLKHWMTAMALIANLVYFGFPLLPIDPCDPMLMVFFNAAVFAQIAAHSAADAQGIQDPARLLQNKKNLMSVRAMFRWAVAATLSGFSITWIVRWFFPLAQPAYFGAIIQVAQATVVTVYLALSTNTWSDSAESNVDGADAQRSQSHFPIKKMFKKDSVFAGVSGATVTSLVIVAFLKGYASDPTTKVACLFAVVVLGYPTLHLLHLMVHDFAVFVKVLHQSDVPLEQLVSFFVTWSHTPGGRLLPLVFFGVAISFVSGVSMVGVLLTSFCVAIVSAFIYVVTISRMGFLRALFEGHTVAVGVITLAVGIWIGSSHT